MSIPSGNLAVLVIFILIHGCVSGLPVINPAVNPVHDIDRVCHNAGYALFNIYSSLGLKNEFLVEGITTKPAKGLKFNAIHISLTTANTHTTYIHIEDISSFFIPIIIKSNIKFYY